MVVGRYLLMGLLKKPAYGLEKSRSEERSENGSVGTGAGTEGSSEAALSGPLVPAGVSWAKLEGIHDAIVSISAATARSLPPACLRPAFSELSIAVISWPSNTRVRCKCMFPLHELLRHVGCHSTRRPETLSGRKFVVIQGNFCFRTADRFNHHYAIRVTFVPCTPACCLCSCPIRHKVQKAEYIPTAVPGAVLPLSITLLCK